MKQFETRLKELLDDQELFLFLESLKKEPRKSIRLNPLRKPVHLEVAEKIPWCDRGYFFDIKKFGAKPNLHPALLSGSVFIQEAGAMEVVENLDVHPGMNVLDLCAAPGAKSTHIGEFLKGEGWLVANEVVRERVKVLDALLMRHGVSNSAVYSLKPHELAERFSDTFDRILVDAPCSGESLFAKRKEKRTDVSNKEVKQCQKRQLSILDSASQMLLAGGKMIYSTCTYARHENEDVIEAFLTEHKDFDLVSEHRRWPHRDGVPGGYFAVLTKNGTNDRKKITEFDFFKNINGLLRAGLKRWNGTQDLYALTMDAFLQTDDYLPVVTIESDQILKEIENQKLSDQSYKIIFKDKKMNLSFIVGACTVLKSKITLHIPRFVL